MSRLNGNQEKVICGFGWFTYPRVGTIGRKKGHICDTKVTPHTHHSGKHHCHCGEKFPK